MLDLDFRNWAKSQWVTAIVLLLYVIMTLITPAVKVDNPGSMSTFIGGGKMITQWILIITSIIATTASFGLFIDNRYKPMTFLVIAIALDMISRVMWLLKSHERITIWWVSGKVLLVVLIISIIADIQLYTYEYVDADEDTLY